MFLFNNIFKLIWFFIVMNRYVRQEVLAEIGVSGQKKLTNSC